MEKNSKKHQKHILNSGELSLKDSKNVIKKYVFRILEKIKKMFKKCLKTLKTHHLGGFGAPGVLKSDPACIFHAH